MLYRKREIRRGRGGLISSFFEEAKKRPVLVVVSFSLSLFFPFFSFANDTCNTSITSPDCYSFDVKKLYRRLYKVVRKGERFIASGVGRGRGGRGTSTHGYNGSRQSVIYDHGQFPSERIHLYFRRVCSFKLENRVNLERRAGGREEDG